MFFWKCDFIKLLISNLGDCEKFVQWTKSGTEVPLWLWNWWGSNHGQRPLLGGPHLRHHPTGRPTEQQAQWGTVSGYCYLS